MSGGFGNAWSINATPTLNKLYKPVQATQNEKYNDAGRVKAEKAIKYGPDTRNRIHFYTLVNTEASGVVFLHRRRSRDEFTSKDCITCLVTYRRVDLALMAPRASLLTSGGFSPTSEPTQVTQTRPWNSAQVPETSTSPQQSFSDPGLLESRPQPLLRGTVLLSAALTMDPSLPAR